MKQIKGKLLKTEPERKDSKSFSGRLIRYALCYICLALVFYWIVSSDWSQTSVVTEAVNSDALLPRLDPAHEIQQTFTVESEVMSSLDLVVHQGLETDENGTVLFTILDDGKTIWQKAYVLKEIPKDGTFSVDLKDFPEGYRGRRLTLLIQGDADISLWYGYTRSAGKIQVDAASSEKLMVGSKDQNGELVMIQRGINDLPYTRWYWPFFLGVGFLLLIISTILHFRHLKGKTDIFERAGSLIRQYWYLLKTLVSRDFKVRYKSSALGIIWSFLNPLLMTFVYLFVFSTLFRSSIPHFPVYLLSGITLFNYFSEATNLGMQSIVGNAGLISKVYIPKYILPISKVLSSAINMVISLIPLLFMMAVTGTPFHRSLLLLPVVIFFLVMFCVGVSLILSSVMVYFRDIQFLWGICLTILNFFSPIFYPESIIPAQFIQLYHLNPMYQYLFFIRTIVIGGISPTPVTYLYCALASGITLAAGLIVFRKTQSKFVLHL